ncbi:MAG: hypothetical protein ACR2G2_08115 [Pseudonocardia sp.]
MLQSVEDPASGSGGKVGLFVAVEAEDIRTRWSFSLRDTGELTGISFQRVQQIEHELKEN